LEGWTDQYNNDIYQGKVAFCAEDEEREEHVRVAEPQNGEPDPTCLGREADHDVEEEQRPAGAPLDAVGQIREEQPREDKEVL
jgi:hypothetical protein